jgi:hypothetical protein
MSLKARIAEQAEAVIARQWHGKQVSVAADTDATKRMQCFLCGQCPQVALSG